MCDKPSQTIQFWQTRNQNTKISKKRQNADYSPNQLKLCIYRPFRKYIGLQCFGFFFIFFFFFADLASSCTRGQCTDPTISRHLLYRGICTTHEFSSTALPSNYLRSTPFKANVKFSLPAKIVQNVKKTGNLFKNYVENVFLHILVTPFPQNVPQYHKHPLFLFSSSCDLSSGRHRSRVITRSHYFLM